MLDLVDALDQTASARRQVYHLARQAQPVYQLDGSAVAVLLVAVFKAVARYVQPAYDGAS